MTYLPTPRSFVYLLLGLAALVACERKLDPRIQEGYDLVVAGRVDEAIALAESMLEEDPKDAAARNVLGLAHYKAGRLDEAAREYELALELDPDYAEAHFNLGNCYQMQGNPTKGERLSSAQFSSASSTAFCSSRLSRAS